MQGNEASPAGCAGGPRRARCVRKERALSLAQETECTHRPSGLGEKDRNGCEGRSCRQVYGAGASLRK